MSNASKRAHRTIRVSVVAEPIVAWGLERLVQSAHPRLEVVGTCEHLADCLAMLKKIGADVVLIDLDGEHAATGVADLFAQTSVKILAISGSRDVSLLDRAVLAGARGIVEKRASPTLRAQGD
jgi:DNA-binding NarL/FixJ family response regulator